MEFHFFFFVNCRYPVAGEKIYFIFLVFLRILVDSFWWHLIFQLILIQNSSIKYISLLIVSTRLLLLLNFVWFSPRWKHLRSCLCLFTSSTTVPSHQELHDCDCLIHGLSNYPSQEKFFKIEYIIEHFKRNAFSSRITCVEVNLSNILPIAHLLLRLSHVDGMTDASVQMWTHNTTRNKPNK